MANSLRDMPAFNGPPDQGDLFHIVDVSESDPQDRSISFWALWLTIQSMLPPVVEAQAPSVNDDETGNYRIGSMWLDTTGPTLYMATDVTTGAAVWRVMVDWS